MKTVFLFPGQGSQYAGMLNELGQGDAFSIGLYKEVEEVLGVPALSLDSKERLLSTVSVQLCLFIAGVLSAKRMIEAGIVPDFVAGHSIGAFSAAVISNVITFKEGLDLVRTRALLMEQAFPEGYGMAAVLGFSQARLQGFLSIHNKDYQTVYLANSNTADQQVIAGKLSSIISLIPSLQKSGVRKVQILKMSVPSHCELLESVSSVLKEKLDGIITREPEIPYASNHTGRVLKTGKSIKEDLFKSVAMMVRWYEATTLLYELGARIFLEVAPSGVLSKMAEVTFKDAHVLALESSNMETVKYLYKSFKGE